MQEKKEEDLQQVFSRVFEVGIDEVGRGAVFGPVFSAVVVLNGILLGIKSRVQKQLVKDFLYWCESNKI